MLVVRPRFLSEAGRSRPSLNRTSHLDSLLALEQLSTSLQRPVLREQTFVDGQVGFIFTQNIILFFLLHECSVEVGLIKAELVGTCSAGKGIQPSWVSSAGGCSRNCEGVGTIWADCPSPLMMCPRGEKIYLHDGGDIVDNGPNGCDETLSQVKARV